MDDGDVAVNTHCGHREDACRHADHHQVVDTFTWTHR